jgi:predicted flap endonuclease-1-like 5' DNA nuclease
LAWAAAFLRPWPSDGRIDCLLLLREAEISMEYRARQNAVRAEAQSLLSRLRAGRAMAWQGRHALPAGTVLPEASPPLRTALPDPVPPRPIMAESLPAAARPSKPRAAKARATATAMPVAVPATADIVPPPAPAAKPARIRAKQVKPAAAKTPPAEPLTAAPEPVPQLAPRKRAKSRPAAKKPSDAPAGPMIDRLPGIGPGMVWRFNRLGIRSFSDLAASDILTLRQGLGRLHRLVPLDQWIAHVKS